MASRPCDHCTKVKQCRLYIRGHGRFTKTATAFPYLCAFCARKLGYLPKKVAP